MQPLVRLEAIVLVGIGGFAGANLRYFVDLWLPGLHGTVLVNTLGSLALGVLLYEAIHLGVLADETQLVAATGFLSSFTTYSTFAVETVQSPEWALLYVLGSYAFGFAGVLLGRELVRVVERRGGAW